MNTENYSSQADPGQESGNYESSPPRIEADLNYEARPVPPYQKQNTQRKSPALASVFSLMPGMGQIYVGYYQQGFTFIGIFAGTVALLASGSMHNLEPLLGIFLGFFHIFNVIDANRRAHHYNRVMAGLSVDEMPEDFKLPSAGGSTTIGVVLVGVGILFLLDLNANISMAWIEDWWPAILVAIGINMILKSRRKNS